MMKQHRSHDPKQDPHWARGAADIVALTARRQAGTSSWMMDVRTGVYTETLELWNRAGGLLKPRLVGMKEKCLPPALIEYNASCHPGGDHAIWHAAHELSAWLASRSEPEDGQMDTLWD